MLFVLRIDFLPGDDRLWLYLNPTPGLPEPAVPDVLKTDLDLGMVGSLTINNYGGFSTDEIRIGSSFASVTPEAAVPEPEYGVAVALAALIMLISLRRRTGLDSSRSGN